MNNVSMVALVLVGGALVALLDSFFIVNEGEQAIVLQFGEPRQVTQKAGLYRKYPLTERVVFYDKRLLDYDHPDAEVIAGDKKRIVLDTFARYRIVDPLQFLKTVRNERIAAQRLNALVNGALRNIVGKVPMQDMLSKERVAVMKNIRDRVNEKAQDFGIAVHDVRIRRADLPIANSNAIYQRMRSEREREAKEFRAKGQELAAEIRAEANRDRTIILAEARKKASTLRGEGDGESIRIYAQSFGKDPSFYNFYRSLEAYRTIMKEDNTMMILTPDGDFFRYFKNMTGNQKR